MVTLTTAEKALKDVYLGVVANQINIHTNPLMARIKHSSKDVYGKTIRKAAPYGINGGVGAGSETGELPRASQNKFVQFTADLKNLYGKIEISDKAIRASASNIGAFVNLLNEEMEGLVKASAYNLGRMIYGDGTGVVATVAGGTSSDGFGVDKTNNLVEGMCLDMYNGNTKTNGNPMVVTYVDRVNKTIKYECVGGASISNGHKLYVQGSKGNEITGLGAIFGTDISLYGVSKTLFPWMKPYISNTETEISDMLIQQAIDFLDMQVDSKINYITCSAQVRRAYQEYLGAYRRNIDVTELEGGYKTITHNGIPVVADRFVEDDTMYLLNTDDFCLHELCDWKWLEGENGRILKQNPNYPTFSATLVKYAELICDKPCGQAKISKIKSTVTNPFATVVTTTSSSTTTE